MACTTASHNEDLKKENEIKWDLVSLATTQTAFPKYVISVWNNIFI